MLEHSLNLITVLFILSSTSLIAYRVHHKDIRKQYLKRKTQELQEEANLLNIENDQELKNKASLNKKIKNYTDLKDIVEQINQHLDLDSIANSLTDVVFFSLAGNKGTCILYRLDPQTNNLVIFKTKKEEKKLVIKAKEGDIFDHWVLKHSSPLLIEDVKRDFRFDLEKLDPQAHRPLASLISAPLISDRRFLGILRLDSPVTGFYTQDDLRFLATVSELGAVAMENGELFKRTQELSIRDELTSLYTKRYFLERLKEECRRSLRKSQPVSLLMLDIDHFKDYNDKFGHTSGDLVLQMLSRNISVYFNTSESLISRFGGEEFCIILPETDKEKAYTFAEGVRKDTEKNRVVLRNNEVRITVSIGVASFPSEASDPDELILKADQAMYAAKQKGRNRVCLI